MGFHGVKVVKRRGIAVDASNEPVTDSRKRELQISRVVLSRDSDYLHIRKIEAFIPPISLAVLFGAGLIVADCIA